MKRLISLALALALLCVCGAALATSVPSKTTGDLTQFEVTAENIPADSGFVIAPVAAAAEETTPESAAALATAQEELDKLAAAPSAAEYFGEETMAAIAQILPDTQAVTVNEFCPIQVQNYDPSYGAVTLACAFPTTYEADQTVAVLVGIITVLEDGTQSIEWKVFTGVGLANGQVSIEFDPETLMAIQEGTALIAVVS